MWRERRWRFLLNVIEHLPRASFFIEAFADDDEVAEAAADAEAAPHRERLSSWTPEREALAGLYDLTAALVSVLMQVNGNDAPHIPPFPRPETAAARLADRKQRSLHDRLSDALYPS